MNEVQKKLDKANELRDKIEKLSDQLGQARDSMDSTIQPLNELNEREVKMPEVDKVHNALKGLMNDLKGINAELPPLARDGEDLKEDVDKLLEKEKDRKIRDAED